VHFLRFGGNLSTGGSCSMTEIADRAPWKSPESIHYCDEPSVLLIAESPDQIESMRRAAERAGCRIAGTGSLAEAAERIERQVAVDAVAVEAGSEGPPDRLDSLLDRLDSAAREGRYASIVSAPPGLIDSVAARISHPDVHHLCEPGRPDWIEALVAASERRRPRLNDISKDRSTPRLQQLSEEVGRIANILASLSDDDDGAADSAAAEARNASRRVEASQIRAIIRARRMRDHFFKSDLFADPAWDMLLDLMAARLEEQKVAVSSLCIAAAVPPTTALRWIKTLSEQGLFVRVADAEDGRRVFIELSDGAAADLEAYLKSAQRISPMIL
jgi:DNA-binding MarR family transcriptional regulator